MNLLVQYKELDLLFYSDILFKRKFIFLVYYERYFIVNWKIRFFYDFLFYYILLLQVKLYNVYVIMVFLFDIDIFGLVEENKFKVGILLFI